MVLPDEGVRVGVFVETCMEILLILTSGQQLCPPSQRHAAAVGVLSLRCGAQAAA